MPATRKPVKSKDDSAMRQCGCVISVRVIPRSSRVVISQEGSNAFRVKLTSAPVENEANRQLIKVLAAKLSIPAANIRILSGLRSRRKQLKIEQLAEETVARMLQSEK